MNVCGVEVMEWYQGKLPQGTANFTEYGNDQMSENMNNLPRYSSPLFTVKQAVWTLKNLQAT